MTSASEPHSPPHLSQTPAPGSRLIRHRGDALSVELRLDADRPGQAWLRTNLGRAHVRRQEIIGHAEADRAILARDWHDVPMRRVGPARFEVNLPLLDVGAFDLKACFIPDPGGDPLWPAGPNASVKVEPAAFCAGNTIYNAFVRQFGPYQRHRADSAGAAGSRGTLDALDAQGYCVIPPSGRFRDLIRELDFIVGTLGFRILQLLPIHPTPTTYGRMGRFGSPYAVLDFKEVDPALAEFDRHTTPLDQFRELIDAAHQRGARLFMDIPVNHTGWASSIQIRHPEWFARDDQRRFQSPGAWGVTWEDLSKLDYAQRGLWRYIAEVFLYWCRQGVDGFRCDAGYMIPRPVWEYVVARVRQEYPDTLFLLEGLGGKAEVVEDLLSEAGLDWAYSELFQNYDQAQVQAYLPYAAGLAASRGLLVHFAETHDNDRLAARSPAYARMRTALAALCADAGAFGITNGVEWFAREKVDVHGAACLNWDSAENQVGPIARLNALLCHHSCFRAGAELRLVHEGYANALALSRRQPRTGEALLVLANLDADRPTTVAWRTADFEAAGPLWDLVSGQPASVVLAGSRASCDLAPGAVLCLTPRPADVQALTSPPPTLPREPEAALRQRLRAQALALWQAAAGLADLAGADPDDLADRFASDPRAFCAAPGPGLPPVRLATWTWPRDLRRTVMVPPGHALLIEAPHPFVVELRRGPRAFRREWSLPLGVGRHATVLPPADGAEPPGPAELALTAFGPGGPARAESPLLLLPDWSQAAVRRRFAGDEADRLDLAALATNGRGAMAQARAAWPKLRSQYDALLAANLHPDCPVDRRVLLTRCRAWLLNRGYSVDVDRHCLESFAVHEDGQTVWRFAVPIGMGQVVALEITLAMARDLNRIHLVFHRLAAAETESLPDGVPVRLIVRPDIEDRSNHEVTKAYLGPERAWPGAVRPAADGFTFAPLASHRLRVAAQGGTFTPEPEWQYMVAHPVESERGLEPTSDLFSPGYFSFWLRGGESASLQADALTAGELEPALAAAPAPRRPPADQRLGSALRPAMAHFVVRRGARRTVIAGYPWFLDWGRDTLIALRGLIAAGRLDEALDILLEFARFESCGTLPNVLAGDAPSNRDTSDAPLWFAVACSDLRRALPRRDALDADAGGRTLRDVLLSIGASYCRGTPNGIRMDPASGLIYSPPHFTWMDTNHPAGTPRAGYPIEIQALWHATLGLLAEAEPAGPWTPLAAQVRESLVARYVRAEHAHLSDCLHAAAGEPAERAVPDDALRPNQLLAVTLGALAEPAWRQRVVQSCEELLVPGALRSLADRPVRVPQPVRRGSQLLNDPLRPYWGTYAGDEDTRRKPAYHNGTAWTWLLPAYCEALFLAEGEPARPAALAILASSVEVINRGCVGHLPEIADGDAPHRERGARAQAWSATELYRVLALLGGAA